MSDSESGLSLEVVKRQFSETELELRKLLESTKSIQSASDQLVSARGQIEDLGERVTRVLEGWVELSGIVQAATSAIEKTDPAELQRRVADLAQLIEAGNGKADAIGQRLNAIGDTITTGIRRLQLLVVAAIVLVVGGLVAVLVMIG